MERLREREGEREGEIDRDGEIDRKGEIDRGRDRERGTAWTASAPRNHIRSNLLNII